MKILKGAIALAAIIMTAGCSSTSDPSSTQGQTKSTTTAMVMKSTATANTASVGYVTAASFTPIADNFNTADGLQAAWGNGHLPDSMGTDPVGAFRMICTAGQVSYDDPLVYPGQPGASHLHQFYGNITADANSTYASLRENGGSTCGDPTLSYAVNRSGYWMPAMLDGAGNVVKPQYVAIYYKRIPESDPRCHPETNPETAIGICVGVPSGLRWISGYNMQGGTSDAAALFYCQSSDNGTIQPVSTAIKSTMAAVVGLCPAGARLTLNIDGPDCWDGVNLDSPDHRSHVSHSIYYTDSNGVSVQKCDAAHPYHMPKTSIIAIYTVDANFVAGTWHLSSDEMVPGAPAGKTFHADYIEAWSPTVRDGWLKNCIDAHMSCQGGDLGDGTQIKGMTVPTAKSQLIALSSIAKPTTTSSTAVASSTDTSTDATPIVSSPVIVPSSDTTTDTSTTTTATSSGATSTSSGTDSTTTTTASGTTSTTTSTSSGSSSGTTTTSGTSSGTTTAAKGSVATCKGKAKKCSTA